MSKQIVEVEDFVQNRTAQKFMTLLQESYAQDKESFLEDLAEALDVEVEDLPTVDVQVQLSIGKKTYTSSGFEVEEKEEPEDDEDF